MGKRSHGDRDGGGNAYSKKRKYIDSVNHMAKGPAMPYGSQGILITMDCQDLRRGSKEALNVLTEIWDDLCPKDQEADDAQADAPDRSTDFAGLINQEVQDLKSTKKKPFVVHDTGIRTVFYLEMPLKDKGCPGPNEVVLKLMQQTKATKILRFRYCNRFVPCTTVCTSSFQSIKDAAAKFVPTLIDSSEGAEKQSVAVLYEHRAAPPSLDRMAVIDAVMEHVKRPPHEVKLKGASRTVSVQVVRNACALSVLDDYHEWGRYNVKVLCDVVGSENKKSGDAAPTARAAEAPAGDEAAAAETPSSAEADQPTG